MLPLPKTEDMACGGEVEELVVECVVVAVRLFAECFCDALRAVGDVLDSGGLFRDKSPVSATSGPKPSVLGSLLMSIEKP